MRRVLGTLAVLFVVFGVARADAKPRVALAAIVGDESGDVADAVGEALDGSELAVVYPKVVTRAIDKLGYDPEDLSDKQAKKVAAALEVDALIQATFSKKGKHKVLRFKLHVRGKRARGFKVTYNNARSENFQTQLRDKIVERVSGGRLAGGEDEDDDQAKRRQGGDDERAPKRVATDEEEDEGKGEDERADDATPGIAARRTSSRSANRVAVRVDLGISVQNRQLEFTNRSDFPEGPRPFKLSPVPGARIEGELYPFAFSNPKGALAGIGFAGGYDKTLSLTLRTSAEPEVPITADQTHWSLGVRYRIPFGGTSTSPTLTLGVGYQRRAFLSDRSGLMEPRALDIPDTDYRMVDPGLGFRIPLTTALALFLGGKAMVIHDAGAIQTTASYGQAKVFGASGQAGLDLVLANRYALRIVGEFSQVGFDFVGNGFETTGRDLDPTTKDIGGAADRSIGGAATFGVLY